MEGENLTLEVGALESIERAQIDMQIATAKRYPRVMSKVKQDMLSFATLDEETASACFYTLPRGGKSIQGPSVRLAEIAVACYGNLRAGSRIISTVTSGDNPHVVVQSVAHDLEKNTAITIEKRRRITKKKSKETIDEDDINLACNACSAIAFRDAVFKVVPLALIRPVFDAAKKVAIGDATSLVERRGKIIDRLKQMGATEDRILAVLEVRKVDDILLEHLEILVGLGTALKDGELKLEEAFPPAGVPRAEAVPGPAPAKTAPFRRNAATPAAPANVVVMPDKNDGDLGPQAQMAKDAAAQRLATADRANPTTAAVTEPSATTAAQPSQGSTAANTASAEPKPADNKAPAPIPDAKTPSDWLPSLNPSEGEEVLKSVRGWMGFELITDDELTLFARGRGLAKATQNWHELQLNKLVSILKQRAAVRLEILNARPSE